MIYERPAINNIIDSDFVVANIDCLIANDATGQWWLDNLDNCSWEILGKISGIERLADEYYYYHNNQ